MSVVEQVELTDEVRELVSGLYGQVLAQPLGDAGRRAVTGALRAVTMVPPSVAWWHRFCALPRQIPRLFRDHRAQVVEICRLVGRQDYPDEATVIGAP